MSSSHNRSQNPMSLSPFLTITGVLYDWTTPPARQTSAPVILLSPTRDPLSTLAFTTMRFSYTIGEAPVPHSCVSDPTRTVHRRLPAKS